MKPVHQVVRDLEFAARRGELTPTFLEAYATRHAEEVLALYGLAARNGLTVAHEEGRNDHVVEKAWHSEVDVPAVERALDAQSAAVVRAAHEAHDDGRPASLRRRGRGSFYPMGAPD